GKLNRQYTAVVRLSRHFFLEFGKTASPQITEQSQLAQRLLIEVGRLGGATRAAGRAVQTHIKARFGGAQELTIKWAAVGLARVDGDGKRVWFRAMRADKHPVGSAGAVDLEVERHPGVRGNRLHEQGPRPTGGLRGPFKPPSIGHAASDT